MKKRGLNVTRISATDEAGWRKAAQEFATSLHATTPAPEILDMAQKERDAYRARSSGAASRGSN